MSPICFFSRCCVAMLVAVSPHALAEASAGTTLSDALKGIGQSGGECRIDDANQPAWSAERSVVAPDLGCAIDPERLATLRDKSDTLVADLRDAAAHDAFRIDGSVPMTETQLRAKAYLRDKTIVLVGSGKGEREGYAACARLKAEGFKHVRVLQGGLAEWLDRGLPVAGRRPESPDPLARLTPAELWQEAQFDANVVMVLAGRSEIERALPFSVAVSDARPETLKAVLQRRRKALGAASPPAAVVLVAGAELNAERLTLLRRAMRPVPLLTYTDSAEALVRHLDTQRVVWAARERGPRKLACGL